VTTTELLTQLRKLNVTLAVNNGQVVFNGPKGVLTEALRAELSERKTEILEFLKKVAATDARPTEPSLRSVPRDKNPPLSFAQQRLWFLDQLDPGNSVYNVPGALRIRGPLDVNVLQQSLEAIVRRHETLRTTFSVFEGEPVQVIAPSLKLSLPVVDISQFSESERENEALRLAATDARTPFDLGRGPLFRPTLIRLEERDHVLLLTMHHIVSDGWSVGVLYRELSALYRAFANAEASPLPDLAIQYADFAAWQRERLQGVILESQLSYWKKQLEGAPVVLDLPTDRPRPSVQSFRGASRSVEFSTELTRGLKTLSRQEGVTLYMTLLAAFQTLLHRYTGQDDIVVGSPIANRNRIEIEGLIGFFVNTLVLRTDHSGNPQFRDLLRRVRETALEAYAHQDLPFEKLVEELRPDRVLGRSPLFQAMFVFQNTPAREVSFNDLIVSPLRLAGETTKFDLTLSMTEGATGLRAGLQYSIDLFDEPTITRMLGHFQTLLEGIVAHPDHCMSDLPILTEAERLQLLVWSETKEEYPKDICLHQLFEEQAKQTPEAIAVVFEDRQLTYRGLNRRANHVARGLRRLGVGPDILVGLCVERSVELVIGILAILKAGGAYAPFDPSYPKDRLEFMLKDSDVPVLLAQKHVADNLPAHEAAIVYLDVENWDTSSAEALDGANLESQAKPDSLAYVVYTSGSTGKPKGVLVTHDNVVRLFQSTKAWFNFDVSDVWTLFHSYAFDFSVWEIWGALLHGGRLVVVPHPVGRSPEEFAALVKQNGVTVLNQTPSAFRQLMPYLTDSKNHDRLDLRFVIFGGEALELQSLKPWFECYGDENPKLINMYGITETTVHVTYRPIKRADIESGTGSVIGKPIPDLKVYLLDKRKALVPIGVAGEIFVGGAGVAKGYLGRDELTAERFIPDSVSNTPEAKLYRSGDLARWSPDGELEYLGRIDDQVKIRGFRIELGEIEAVLSQHPVVYSSLVVAREDEPGDKRLVAYVVAAPGAILSANELRSFLQQKLPEYMVPSVFMSVGSLPLTPNGKLDRKALPEPDQSRPELDESFAAPRTPVEEILANIWAEVLKLDKVGIHDNFFELGGHSLLATQVIARINDVFGTNVHLRRLFETPTIAGLAVSIAAYLVAKNDTQKTPPIVPRAGTHDFPLSFAQQRLWFLDQLDPGSPTYNVPAAFRLVGKLDTSALEQSFDEIVRRHEALRTVFTTTSGEPAQTVLAPSPVALTCTDISDRPEKDRELIVPDLVREEACQPFDLSGGPLLRTKLLRLAPHDHILCLNMHHIVSDGWSIGVLFRELSDLYRAYGSGKPGSLPELSVQYADYAVWQRQWLQGDELDRQLSYWRKQLGGLSPLQLPTDRNRPSVQTHRGSRATFELSAPLSQALKSLSQKHGVTLFMTLLASFQLLLSRYCGQTDIAVGTPIAGRTRHEIERLIGFFVNTLVLRTNFFGNPTFKELLRQVRETTLEAYTHQDLPFEKLVEELHPERNLSHSPLFQVMFAFQNNADQTLEFEGLTVEPIRTVSDIAKFDLTLTLSEKKGTLGGSLNYNTDLFDASTIDRMLGHFQNLLNGIVANPEQRISELPLLGEAEKHQILVEWNDTQTEYPKDKCIHQLFEEQVERTPDAIALVYENQQLTYRELNNRANQLAHYLQRQGVKPDARVGICVERGLDMVVGLLAVLKAGGAYVPLDPTYPAERLIYMLQDSAPVAILTDTQVPTSVQAELHSALTGRADVTPVIDLQGDANSWAMHPESNPERMLLGLTPAHLAYVIYTSGSTGRPKGVEIEHRNAVNFLHWAQCSFTAQQLSRTLFSTSLNFDLAMYECFAPLASGATSQIVRNTLTLVQTPHPVTLINTVPSTMHGLLDAHGIPDSVRTVNLAGEPLKRALVERLFAETSVDTVCNLYGPSETTTYSTWVVMRREHGHAAHVGRPLANTRIYLLDARGQPVPVGVVGEMYIGGAGVARGYLNQPELTAERFVADPFVNEVNARMYRTGDLARYLPDGNIEFVGRMDNQVKIRGYRIELGEIEATLGQLPSIRESVVLAREDNPADWRLVAYVVAAPGSAPTINELRGFLKQKLPEYMVPSAYVFLESLPLTPNGKLNRKALPSPDQSKPDLDKPFVAPGDASELELTKIWRKLLGVENIGVTDNFFDLGGHSLLAVQLLVEIEKTMGRRLPIATIFQAPTIEQLAGILEQIKRSESPYSLWLENPSLVVPFNPKGSKPPLFWFSWGPWDFRLPRYLDSDQPVYGLQHQSQDGHRALYTSIEKMAAYYVREVRTVQAKGPYFLGGYCIGGMVAFEMAQQLQKQGQEVALVVLLDPVNPMTGELSSVDKPVPSLLSQVRWFFNKVSRHLRELAPLGPEEKLSYALVRVNDRIMGIREKISWFGRRVLCEYFGCPLPPSLRTDYIVSIYGRARRAYVPKLYRGRGILFKTQGRYRNGQLPWENLIADGLETQELDTDHEDVFKEPYVRTFAERLKTHLSEAQRLNCTPPVGDFSIRIEGGTTGSSR
jgi:amino acid adenylation domain-containing protein